MNTQIEFDEDNNFFGDEERSYVKNHILRCNCDNRTHVIVEKLIEKEHELQRLKQEIELIKLCCFNSSDAIKEKVIFAQNVVRKKTFGGH